MTTTITKSVTRSRVKDATLGIIEAVFASNLVDSIESATEKDIDADGDVTLKGAFTEGQPCVISAYGHKSWEGALPLGKGVINEVGDEAIVTCQFFMDTPHGSDAFKTIAELSKDDLQEWSYSLHDVVASRGRVGSKNVRVLEKVKLVKEVSPCLMGAGVRTRSLSVKDQNPTKQFESSLRRLLRAAGRARWPGWTWVEDYDVEAGVVVFGIDDYTMSVTRLVQVDFTYTDTSVDLGETETEVHETVAYLPKAGRRLQFSEHVAEVVADVDALTARAKEVKSLRAEKGKTISDTTIEGLRQLADLLDGVKSLLVEAPTPQIDDGAQAEFLRFVSLTAQGA